MKNIVRLFVAVLLFVSSFTNLYAQPFPVSSSVQLTTPQLPQLESLADPTNNTVFLSLVLNDITQPTYDLRLRMIISGKGINIETDENAFVPPPIKLAYNVPVLLTGADLAEYFKLDNLRFSGITKEQYLSQGTLPEGFYSVCFEAYDYNRFLEPPVSNRGCATSSLVIYDPPVILNPIGESEATTPQYLRFDWQSRHAGAFPVEYELAVYEKRPGLTVDQTLVSMPPYFRTVTSLPSYLYTPADPILKEEQEYVTVVRVRDLTGKNSFRNRGFSKPEVFILKIPCAPGRRCDDKNDCTEDDTFDEKCNCVGTPVYDLDGDGICDPVVIPPPTVVHPIYEVCETEGESVISWIPNHNLNLDFAYELSVWLDKADVTKTEEYLQFQKEIKTRYDELIASHGKELEKLRSEHEKFSEEHLIDLKEIEQKCIDEAKAALKDFTENQAQEKSDFRDYLEELSSKCEADKAAATKFFLEEQEEQMTNLKLKQAEELTAFNEEMQTEEEKFAEEQQTALEQFLQSQTEELETFLRDLDNILNAEEEKLIAQLKTLTQAEEKLKEDYEQCVKDAKNFKADSRSEYLESTALVRGKIKAANLAVQALRSEWIEERDELKTKYKEDISEAKTRAEKRKIRADFKQKINTAKSEFVENINAQKAIKAEAKAEIAELRSKLKELLSDAETVIADMRAACEDKLEAGQKSVSVKRNETEEAIENLPTDRTEREAEFKEEQAVAADTFIENQKEEETKFLAFVKDAQAEIEAEQTALQQEMSNTQKDKKAEFLDNLADCKILIEKEEAAFTEKQAAAAKEFQEKTDEEVKSCELETTQALTNFKAELVKKEDNLKEKQGKEVSVFEEETDADRRNLIAELESKLKLPELIYRGMQDSLYRHVLPADFSLADGQTYTVQVQALSEYDFVTVENKGFSEKVTFTTVSGKPDNLETPYALEAKPLSANSFVAQWKSVISAEFYILEVAEDEYFRKMISRFSGLKIPANRTSYTLTNLEGSEFYYRVRAGNSCYLSEFSNTIEVSLSNPDDCKPGNPCDDKNPCTIYDTYDKACNCVGKPNPKCDDPCKYGQPCDDKDPCTENDTFNEDCKCVGVLSPDTDKDGVCDILDQCPKGDDSVDLNKNGTPDTCEDEPCPGQLIVTPQNNSGCDFCAVLYQDSQPDLYRFSHLEKIVLRTPDYETVTFDLFKNGQGFDFPYFVNEGEYYKKNCSVGTTESTINDLVVHLQDWITSNGYDGEVELVNTACLESDSGSDYTTLSITGTKLVFKEIEGYYCSSDSDSENLALQTGTAEFIQKNCIEDVTLTVSAPDICANPVYLWSNDETTATITIDTSAHLYNVTVMCEDGCEYTTNEEYCLVGAPCDDADACTNFDVIQADCSCSGVEVPDTDKDGVCDTEDVCPGFHDNGPDIDGDGIVDTCDDCPENGSCNDGDPHTQNDTWILNPDITDPFQAPPPGVPLCLCIGTPIENCTEELFLDADGDGICDAVDECPNIPNDLLTPNDEGVLECELPCEELDVVLCPVANTIQQLCDYQLYYDNFGAIKDDGQNCRVIQGIKLKLPGENQFITVGTGTAADSYFTFPYCNGTPCTETGAAGLDKLALHIQQFLQGSGYLGTVSVLQEVPSLYSTPGNPDPVSAFVIEQTNVVFKKIVRLCANGEYLGDQGSVPVYETNVEEKPFVNNNCQGVPQSYKLIADLEGGLCENSAYSWTFQGEELSNAENFVLIDVIENLAEYNVTVTCTKIDGSTCSYAASDNTECVVGTSCDDNNPDTVNDLVTPCCGCVGTYVAPPVEPCTMVGEPCDDGNPCTTDDIYEYAHDGTRECLCIGQTAVPDSDNDSVCDSLDVCDGFPDFIDTDGDGVPDGCDDICTDESGEPLDYVAAIRAIAWCVFSADNTGVSQSTYDAWNVTSPGSIPSEEEMTLDRFQDMEDLSVFFKKEVVSDNPELLLQSNESEGGTGVVETSGDETTDMEVENLNEESDNYYDSAYLLDGMVDISLIMIDTDTDGVCDLFDICPGGNDNVDVNFNGIPDACEETIDPADPNIRFDLYLLYKFDRSCIKKVELPYAQTDALAELWSAYECELPATAYYAEGELNCACDCEAQVRDSDEDGMPDEVDQCQGSPDYWNDDCDENPNGCDPDVCDDTDCPVGPCGAINVAVYNDETGKCDCIEQIDTSSPTPYGDADGDGVCDLDDKCPGHDDTANADNDAYPDACDLCPEESGTIGSPCDDGNSCTDDEVLSYTYYITELSDYIGADLFAQLADPTSLSEIYGLFPGYDDPDNYTGPDFPEDLGAVENVYMLTAGEEDDPIETVYVQVINGCGCIGTEYDSDYDGVCDPLDICPGFPDQADLDGDGVTDNDFDGDGIPDGCDPPFYEIGCPPERPTFLTGDYTGIFLDYEGIGFPADAIPDPVSFTLQATDGSMIAFENILLTTYQETEGNTRVLYEIPGLDVSQLEGGIFIGEVGFSEGQYCNYGPPPPPPLPDCPEDDNPPLFSIIHAPYGITLSFTEPGITEEMLPAAVTFSFQTTDQGLVTIPDVALTEVTLQDGISFDAFYEIPDLSTYNINNAAAGSDDYADYSLISYGDYECNYTFVLPFAGGGSTVTMTTNSDPDDDEETGGGNAGGPSTGLPFACPEATNFHAKDGFLVIGQTLGGELMNNSTLPELIVSANLVYTEGAITDGAGNITETYTENDEFLLVTDIPVPGYTDATELTPIAGLTSPSSVSFGEAQLDGEEWIPVSDLVCSYEANGSITVPACGHYTGEPCDDLNSLTHDDRYNADCDCVGEIVHDADGDGVHDTEDQCPGYPDIVNAAGEITGCDCIEIEEDGATVQDCPCPIPQIATQDYGDGQDVELLIVQNNSVSVTLVEEPKHLGYSITWTPNAPDEPLETDEREFTVTGLEPGFVYEFTVTPTCESEYGSSPLTFSIEIGAVVCSSDDSSIDFDTQCEAVEGLNIGDNVIIGSFTVNILSLTGSGNTYSGTAFAYGPLFAIFDKDLEFSDVQFYHCDKDGVDGIDTDASGDPIIYAQGTMSVPIDGDLDALIDAFDGDAVLGEGDLLDDLESALNVLADRVDEMESVEDYYADVNNIATVIATALPDFPFLEQSLIDDLNVSIECFSTISTTNTFEQCQNGGNTENPGGMAGAVDALLDFISNLYNADYQVHFYSTKNVTATNASGQEQKYGFDKHRYTIHNNLYDEMTIAQETYYVPWKSVPKNGTDKVDAAKINIEPLSNEIQFKDSGENPIDGNENMTGDDFGGIRQLDMPGRDTDGAVNEIFAIQNVLSGHNHNTEEHIHIAGKLNVISYSEKSVDLVLVKVQDSNVENSTNFSDLPNKEIVQAALNEVYEQAVTKVNLNAYKTLNTSIPSPFSDLPSGWPTAYNNDMGSIISTYRENNEIDDETYYIFLLPTTFQTEGIRGFMPRKRNFGFVFVNSTNQLLAEDNLVLEDLYKTIAHELGHGAFRLKHSFKTFPPPPELNGEPSDNLMDYGKNGTHLLKYQWDLIQNPESVFTLFDDDNDAMSSTIVSMDDLSDFRNDLPGTLADDTYTFIAPSGRPITVPANTSKVVFNTGDEIKVGNPCFAEFDVYPFGSLRSFEFTNTATGVLKKYETYIQCSTGKFAGYGLREDNTDYYADTYTHLLGDLTLRKAVVGYPCLEPSEENDDSDSDLIYFRVGEVIMNQVGIDLSDITGTHVAEGDRKSFDFITDVDIQNERPIGAIPYPEYTLEAKKFLNAVSDLADCHSQTAIYAFVHAHQISAYPGFYDICYEGNSEELVETNEFTADLEAVQNRLKLQHNIVKYYTSSTGFTYELPDDTDYCTKGEFQFWKEKDASVYKKYHDVFIDYFENSITDLPEVADSADEVFMFLRSMQDNICAFKGLGITNRLKALRILGLKNDLYEAGQRINITFNSAHGNGSSYSWDSAWEEENLYVDLIRTTPKEDWVKIIQFYFGNQLNNPTEYFNVINKLSDPAVSINFDEHGYDAFVSYLSYIYMSVISFPQHEIFENYYANVEGVKFYSNYPNYIGYPVHILGKSDGANHYFRNIETVPELQNPDIYNLKLRSRKYHTPIWPTEVQQGIDRITTRLPNDYVAIKFDTPYSALLNYPEGIEEGTIVIVPSMYAEYLFRKFNEAEFNFGIRIAANVFALAITAATAGAGTPLAYGIIGGVDVVAAADLLIFAPAAFDYETTNDSWIPIEAQQFWTVATVTHALGSVIHAISKGGSNFTRILGDSETINHKKLSQLLDDIDSSTELTSAQKIQGKLMVADLLKRQANAFANIPQNGLSSAQTAKRSQIVKQIRARYATIEARIKAIHTVSVPNRNFIVDSDELGLLFGEGTTYTSLGSFSPRNGELFFEIDESIRITSLSDPIITNPNHIVELPNFKVLNEFDEEVIVNAKIYLADDAAIPYRILIESPAVPINPTVSVYYDVFTVRSWTGSWNTTLNNFFEAIDEGMTIAQRAELVSLMHSFDDLAQFNRFKNAVGGSEAAQHLWSNIKVNIAQNGNAWRILDKYGSALSGNNLAVQRMVDDLATHSDFEIFFANNQQVWDAINQVKSSNLVDYKMAEWMEDLLVEGKLIGEMSTTSSTNALIKYQGEGFAIADEVAEIIPGSGTSSGSVDIATYDDVGTGPFWGDDIVASSNEGTFGIRRNPVTQKAGCSGVSCFVAETQVHLPTGKIKNIEEIERGDVVLSWDFEKRDTVRARVKETFSKTWYNLCKIVTNTDTIFTTGNHPFYLPDERKFSRADSIKSGMRLLTLVGSMLLVNEVSSFDTTVQVFNFEVENTHNYYVGNSGTLVHNDGDYINFTLAKAEIGTDDIPTTGNWNNELITRYTNFLKNNPAELSGIKNANSKIQLLQLWELSVKDANLEQINSLLRRVYNDIVHSGGNLTELGDDIGYWTKDLIENFYAQLKENPLVVAEMNNNLKTVAAWDLLSHRELSGSAGEFIPNHPFAINLDYLRVYGLDTRHEIYGDDSWFDFKSYFEYGEGAIKLSNYSSYGIATEEASIIRRWTRGKKINTAILDNVQNGTPFTLWEVSFKKLLKDVLQKLPDNESTVIYRATSRSDIPSWSEQDLITYETFMATSESGEDLAFIIDNYPDLVQGYHTIFIIENGTNGKLIKDFSAYAGEGEILHNIEETNKLRVLEILENQPHPLAEFITKPENNIPVRVIRLSQE